MSTPPEHALLVLLHNHRADPASFPLPEFAPLIQIACAMASDDLRRCDRDRERRAMGLLHTPLIQGLHKVIGQRPITPVVYPTLISTFQLTPGLSKAQRYRQAGEIRQGGSMTLQNEVSQRAHPTVSGLEDIKGLALADLKLLRSPAIAADCWWSGLDVLFAPAAEPQPVAAPAAQATQSVSADDVTLDQLAEVIGERVYHRGRGVELKKTIAKKQDFINSCKGSTGRGWSISKVKAWLRANHYTLAADAPIALAAKPAGSNVHRIGR